MNSKVRQRVMRSFLAGLLQSDLSAADLQNLADELTQGTFGRELGEFIQYAMLNLSNSGHPKSQTGSDAIEAYDTIMRRRLSKKIVLQLMMSASPWIKAERIQTDGTMKELLERYFMVASTQEAKNFLNILQGEAADPYLKGISRRG